MKEKNNNKNKIWEPYLDYITKTCINYKVVDKLICNDCPIFLVEQSEKNRIALAFIVTNKKRILKTNLSDGHEILNEGVFNLVMGIKRALETKDINIPLIVNITRLVFTPKSKRKQLRLNKVLYL